jgi:hypothetical protein
MTKISNRAQLVSVFLFFLLIFFQLTIISRADRLSVPTILPASPNIDSGQSITLAVSGVSGGTPPYTYNWFTGPNCQTLIPGETGNSITISIKVFPPSAQATKDLSVNAIDSASTPINSVCSAVDEVTVNTTLVADAITPSSPAIDSGQSIDLTANPSGGTPDYSYAWYSGSGCSGSVLSTTPLFSPSPSITTTYYYQVSDSSYIPSNACSAGDTVTVNPTLVLVSATSSNSIADQGQPQILTADISGGTPAYTYNFLVYNSAGQVANLLLTNSNLATNSFMYVQNADWGIGTFTADLSITDSATTQVTVSNIITYVAMNTASTSTSTSTSTSSTSTIAPTTPSGGGTTTPPFGTGNVTSVVAYTAPGTNNTGYEVLNFTEQHSVTFSINGKQFSVVLNSISPSEVDITVNGKSYSIASGQTQLLSDPPDYMYFASLISISYLPVLHSVDLALYGMSLHQTETTTTSTTTTIAWTVPTTIVIPRNIVVPGNVRENPPVHATPEESNGSNQPGALSRTWVSLGGIGVAVAVAVAAGIAYSRTHKTANEKKHYR